MFGRAGYDKMRGCRHLHVFLFAREIRSSWTDVAYCGIVLNMRCFGSDLVTRFIITLLCTQTKRERERERARGHVRLVCSSIGSLLAVFRGEVSICAVLELFSN